MSSKHWAVLVAVMGGAMACSPPAPMEDAGPDVVVMDVAADAFPDIQPDRPDVTMPTDVAPDVRPDVPRDVPPPINPCDMARITDLTMMMPGPDGAVHYTGDNNMASMTGGATPTAGCLGNAMGMASFQVAMRYRMRGTGTITVSTANPGTPMMFDTVVIVTDTCSPTGMVLACNDDINTGMGVYRSTATSTRTLTMGTEVFIFVGGYTGPGESTSQGTFELTVRENTGTPTDGGTDASTDAATDAATDVPAG